MNIQDITLYVNEILCIRRTTGVHKAEGKASWTLGPPEGGLLGTNDLLVLQLSD